MASEVLNVPVAPSAPKKKLSKWEVLKKKVKEEPMVYIFLGLTTAALTGGLFSLYKDNKKMSQRMMRLRVLFQFCTIGTLIGGVYYRAYNGTLQSPVGAITQDNRVFLHNGPFANNGDGQQGQTEEKKVSQMR